VAAVPRHHPGQHRARHVDEPLAVGRDHRVPVVERGALRRLEPGDLEEGINAAEQIGDDRIQQKTQGRIDPESWTHGSAEQRRRWLRTGFDAGNMQACETFTQDFGEL